MLVKGKIEAGKSCHHRNQCGFAKEGCCNREQFINNPYSCGAARGFEIEYLRDLKVKVRIEIDGINFKGFLEKEPPTS